MVQALPSSIAGGAPAMQRPSLSQTSIPSQTFPLSHLVPAGADDITHTPSSHDETAQGSSLSSAQSAATVHSCCFCVRSVLSVSKMFLCLTFFFEHESHAGNRKLAARIVGTRHRTVRGYLGIGTATTARHDLHSTRIQNIPWVARGAAAWGIFPPKKTSRSERDCTYLG